jgi:hypothetical protein
MLICRTTLNGAVMEAVGELRVLAETVEGAARAVESTRLAHHIREARTLWRVSSVNAMDETTSTRIVRNHLRRMLEG